MVCKDYLSTPYFSTFAKIVSVPFDALVNAKEDMLPFLS